MKKRGKYLRRYSGSHVDEPPCRRSNGGSIALASGAQERALVECGRRCGGAYCPGAGSSKEVKRTQSFGGHAVRLLQNTHPEHT